MKLLLDTHVWLWWHSEPERLGEKTLAMIANLENELILSAASVWEMAIKKAIGKLPLPVPVLDYVESKIGRDDLHILNVSHTHAALVESLPMLHSDPFDRLLLAQSIYLDMLLVTADRQILKYQAQLFDAML